MQVLVLLNDWLKDFSYSNGHLAMTCRQLVQRTEQLIFKSSDLKIDNWEWLLENFYVPIDRLCLMATRNGDFDLLCYFCDLDLPLDSEIIVEAARIGRRDIIDWCLTKGINWSLLALRAASSAGQVEIVEWSLDKHPIKHKQVIKKNIVEPAVCAGQVGLLRWLADKQIFRFSDPNLAIKAAEHGHLNVLKFLHSIGTPLSDMRCKLYIEYHSSNGGFIDILDFMLEIGQLVLSRACYVSVFDNCKDINTLNWLKEHNCPWDSTLCLGAAKTGNLEMVKWAYERNGHSLDDFRILLEVYNSKNEEFKAWIMRHRPIAWDETILHCKIPGLIDLYQKEFLKYTR